jgi:pimeloyl-ACP methyl ester carboxylesterase
VVISHAEHAPVVVEEESLHSADGTRIGFRRFGSGPAIVFVHGSVSTHTDWMPAAKLLSTHYTCYVMDRRGRRGSGFGNGRYSVEREYEDVCAVLDAAGPGALLAGHSYGAICAMGAALLHPVPKLVLYEPPLPVGGLIAGEKLPVYARAVAEGHLERAMEMGLNEFTRLRPQVIEGIRTSRGWPRLCHLAPTWTRELEAMDALQSSVEHYRALACPVLLLIGTISTEHPMQNATRALAATLPNVRLRSLEGQDHLGLRGAPEQVAHHIAEFLAD